ncbi:hypothetical protein HPT27_16665 [Permianibacter sp. IMCC34836]|uniref:hypothetical protein n=1 Tax=Permianibacter fluminis TaxID=2738515 RepID=UPI00155304AC|nr:hypothetical protein [Permianibacter fluminis]NQD38657.1 hypothetical protein [Permianibacter fluminis]
MRIVTWLGRLSGLVSFLLPTFLAHAEVNGGVQAKDVPLVLAQVSFDPDSAGNYPTKIISPRFLLDGKSWLALEVPLSRKDYGDKRDADIPSTTADLPLFPRTWITFDQSLRISLDVLSQAVFKREASLISNWYPFLPANQGVPNTAELLATGAAQIVRSCSPGWVLDAVPAPDTLVRKMGGWASNQPIPTAVAQTITESDLPEKVRLMFRNAFTEEEAWQLKRWSVNAVDSWSGREQERIPASLEILRARPVHSWLGRSLTFPDGTTVFSFEVVKTYKDALPEVCDENAFCRAAELCDQAPTTFQGFGLQASNGMASMLEMKSWYGKCGDGNRPGADKILSAGFVWQGKKYLLDLIYGLESSGTLLYELDGNKWVELSRQGSGC